MIIFSVLAVVCDPISKDPFLTVDVRGQQMSNSCLAMSMKSNDLIGAILHIKAIDQKSVSAI